MDYSRQLLEELTNANGAPGHEGPVTDIMKSHLEEFTDIEYDRLGSLMAFHKGQSDSPRILVDSHLDEIGFMVREITDAGFIKFLPLGGWWGHVLLGQRMRVITKNGPVLGVVGTKPPHLLKDKEKKTVMELDDMFIDVGAMDGYDIKEKLGVRLGDVIVPDSVFTEMNNPDIYMAKAFDNRVAVALVIDVMRHFKDNGHPNLLIGSGSVQEEVGLRGAATVAHVSNPDVAIIVDVGIAFDIPGFEKRSERFGGGPVILMYEAGMISHTGLRQLFQDTAEEHNIPFALSYMQRGSSDGARIHITRAGVPAIYIGPPTRYIHSHNSLLYRKDYDDTLKLLIEVVKKLDKETVASLTAR